MRTRVFPEPAPARTRSGPSPCETAAACSGLRPSRRSSGRATKGRDGSARGASRRCRLLMAPEVEEKRFLERWSKRAATSKGPRNVMRTRRRTLRRLSPLCFSPSSSRRSRPLAEPPREPGVRPGPFGVDGSDRRWLEPATERRPLSLNGLPRTPPGTQASGGARIARESGGHPGRDGGVLGAVRFRPSAAALVSFGARFLEQTTSV